jgi:hypothetical protein
MIPFAEFGPDRSTFDPSFSDRMENVLPKANSYGPFPAFVALSDALPDAPMGTYLAYVENGQYRLFAGTQDALYMFDVATLGWTDVSRVGGYTGSADRKWDFAQFGSRLIATNGANEVQWIDINTPVAFADLAGSPPKAYYTGTLGDFVVLANQVTDQRRIQWSGLNNSEWWTPRERSSDFQSFPDGGEIMGFAGGNKGCVIFHAESIREGTLALDTSLVMTFSQTVANHGCLAPRSIVQTGQGIFYLSDDGFYRYGTPPVPIGVERVDNFFLQDVDHTELFHVYGSEDPNRKIVYWAYRSNENTVPMSYDKVLLYHYGIDRWSLLKPGTILTGLIDAVTPGYTLDSLDSLGLALKDLPFSLDSRAWAGSTPLIAAINDEFKFGVFSGAPLAATLQTGDADLSGGTGRTFVRGFRPLCDAPMINGRVRAKDWAGDTGTWKLPAAASQRTGLIPARASGRFHRFEITIPSDPSNVWGDIHGVEPDGVTEGQA